MIGLYGLCVGAVTEPERVLPANIRRYRTIAKVSKWQCAASSSFYRWRIVVNVLMACDVFMSMKMNLCQVPSSGTRSLLLVYMQSVSIRSSEIGVSASSKS